MTQPSHSRRAKPSRVVLWLVASALASAAATASAQRLGTEVAATAGSGLELGTGQAATVVHRSPVFVDIALRTWNDEDPSVVLGGSLRVEVDGRTSVAAVPRAELSHVVGALLLRPGVAVPFFFAPFSMLGIEGSITARYALGDSLGIVGWLAVDAFFFGSDLPKGSAVLMFNGAIGVDLRL